MSFILKNETAVCFVVVVDDVVVFVAEKCFKNLLHAILLQT